MAWNLDDVVVLSFSSIAKVFAMTFLLPLDALIYTVPVLVPLLAQVTLKDFAIFCIATAIIGFLIQRRWRDS